MIVFVLFCTRFPDRVQTIGNEQFCVCLLLLLSIASAACKMFIAITIRVLDEQMQSHGLLYSVIYTIATIVIKPTLSLINAVNTHNDCSDRTLVNS